MATFHFWMNTLLHKEVFMTLVMIGTIFLRTFFKFHWHYVYFTCLCWHLWNGNPNKVFTHYGKLLYARVKFTWSEAVYRLLSWSSSLIWRKFSKNWSARSLSLVCFGSGHLTLSLLLTIALHRLMLSNKQDFFQVCNSLSLHWN